jgi:DNA repair protein RadD
VRTQAQVGWVLGRKLIAVSRGVVASRPSSVPSPSRTTMILRPYQQDAVDKIRWALEERLEGNDLVVLPTAAGKSVVIAHLSKEIDRPLLILQPTKEILEQNLAKLSQYVDPSEIGVYSASMGSKVLGRYTFATIQSIYRMPEAFAHFGLVIIDEAHMVNPKEMGMYKTFLKAIGNPKVIGFTATPYRMDTTYLDYGLETVRVVTTVKLVNRMKGFFWTRILVNVSIEELIEQGYLCQLEYIDRSIFDHSEIPMNVSRSDFNLDGYEKKLSTRQKDIQEAIKYAEDTSNSVLVFCTSVSQANHLSKVTPGSAVVTGKTPKRDRDLVINGFKQGLIKTVFNVGVLTTGFDHPALDCIVMLRPTRSIMLYCQMLGRGVRIAPGKTSCKVIDLTSNVKSMGRFETIKVVKKQMWELISEKGYWHGRELYHFDVEKKKPAPAGVQSTYGRIPESVPRPIATRDGLLGEMW